MERSAVRSLGCIGIVNAAVAHLSGMRTGRVLLSTIGAPCGAVRADKPIHKVRASVAAAEIELCPEIGVFSLRIPRHCTQPLTRLLLGQFDSFHGVSGA